MKIHPSNIATAVGAEPVNKPREATAAALKPLSGADFADQLRAVVDATKQGDGDAAPDASPRYHALRPLTALDMVPGVKGPVAPLKPLDTNGNGRPVPPTALLPLAETQYQHANSRQPQTEHEKIEAQARKWVSQTFYGAMLKQMRESPFKSELFSGGRGGQAFSTLLDQHLADHMSRASGSKLVNALTRKLEAKAGYQKQGASKTNSNTDNPNTMRMPHVAPSVRG